MRFRVIIDRREALWTLQQAFRNVGDNKNIKVPASLIQIVLKSILNSPAYSFLTTNIIYLQSEIPEDYLYLILAHEELHLLSYDIIKEEEGHKRASRFSKFIDNPLLTKWLCSTFEIDFRDFVIYLYSYLGKNLPIISGILKLKRKLRRYWNAISKRQGKRKD